MSQVLMLLKCNGLQFDDRVRKECASILKISGLTSEIHVLENQNRSVSGEIFETNSVFKSYFLVSRKIFKGNSLLFLKLLELFMKVLPSTWKRRKAVWLHDPLMFVFVPYFTFLRKLRLVEKIVWDQHELPPEYFLQKRTLRFCYKLAMNMVDVRIHANKQRADYLNKVLGENYDYLILNNYVDNVFLAEKAHDLSDDLSNWLAGEDFLLLQSGAYYERNFESAVEAICKYGKLKCIVIGGTNVDLGALEKKYENFASRFTFIGMVPQIRLVDYIDKAVASLILYKNTIPNSYFCEPNRLYQASCRGAYVIVGNNPPMRDFVNRNKNGYILESDGNCANDIIESLKYIEVKMHEKKKIKSDWSAQDSVFKKIFP